MGISAAWLITIRADIDALTLLAAAAVQTQRILLGSSVLPTYPRHPVAVAQQAQVLGQLAPGRFRLGVGPSRRRQMEGIFGANYRAPLGHLQEYLRILKALLHEGKVDFEGRYYRSSAQITAPMAIPVMASALGPKAFELCGAEADGAISWLLPGTYIRDVALPALKAGAEQAGRPVPPLIVQVPVCAHDNPDDVRAAVRRQYDVYLFPEYVQLFTASGFPECSQGTWSEAMIDAIVPWGGESQVAERLMELFSFGATEIIVSPVLTGGDWMASVDRTLRLLAQVAQEVAGD